MTNFSLTFSDAAKFADIARSLVNGKGFTSLFSFFGGPPVVLPYTPLSISFFFKLFGIGDFAVIANSFFYYILTLLFTYLLTRKIFSNNIIALCSVFVIAFNNDLITYATNGSSESPFIFQIVAVFYLISLRKRWSTLTSFVVMILMYITRPQAFIYIAGAILFKLLIEHDRFVALKYFVIISAFGILFDLLILTKLKDIPFVYSIFSRGFSVVQISAGTFGTEGLRTGTFVGEIGIVALIKKVFYDLYNFYKFMPDIINPYLFAFFAISLFKKTINKFEGSFRIATVFVFVSTLLITAGGIPAYRYIHPVIPFIFILAISTMHQILYVMVNKRFVTAVMFCLAVFFGVGQSLGIAILDSRFRLKSFNTNKPHIYKLLGEILKSQTSSNALVMTNLDTWGSWYGERKTVWFSLDPKQIVNPITNEVPFDAIYLTDYLINDQNYYMGKSWRSIFENPNNPKKWICDKCDTIQERFILKGVYNIDSSENYEKMNSKAVLLIKK